MTFCDGVITVMGSSPMPSTLTDDSNRLLPQWVCVCGAEGGERGRDGGQVQGWYWVLGWGWWVRDMGLKLDFGMLVGSGGAGRGWGCWGV